MFVHIVPGLSESSRVSAPLGMMDECLIKLALYETLVREILVTKGSGIGHRAENGKTILDGVGSKLIKVQLLGGANGLCLGHDNKRAADRRLYVVIDLSRDESGSVPPIPDVSKSRILLKSTSRIFLSVEEHKTWGDFGTYCFQRRRQDLTFKHVEETIL